MSSSTIRFTGLNSGLDTESLIKASLLRYQNRIDKQVKKQTSLEWKTDAYKTINKTLQDFKTNYVDKLRMASTYATRKAVVSDDTYLTVKSGSNMPEGSYTISDVKLAKNAATNNKSMELTNISDSTKLSDLGVTGTTNVKVGNIQITVKADDTISSLSDKISAASDGKLKLELNSTSGELTINNDTGSAVKLSYGAMRDGEDKELFKKLGFGAHTYVNVATSGTTGSTVKNNVTEKTSLTALGINAGDKFKINGHEITISASDTIDVLESMIQSADANLEVNFDSTNKMLFITNKVAGEQIDIEDPNGVTAKLGITGVTVGNKASLKFNGTKIESDSNEISVNGFNFTLKEETPTGKTLNLTSTMDTEGTVDFIKKFVEEYNKIIGDLNTKISTRTSSKYEVLTDDEKEKYTDSEVDKIEQKVKDGLFYQDSTLTAIRDTYRDALSTVVNNSNTQYKILADIGITTTSNWKDPGKLQLDESKLKAALDNNPEDVINLLTGYSSDEDARAIYEKETGENNWASLEYKDKKSYLDRTKGIFAQLNDKLATLTKSSDFRTYGSYYDDKKLRTEATSIANLIDLYQDQYDEKEEALYKKYAAMETALSKITSQTSSLTSMLGLGQ